MAWMISLQSRERVDVGDERLVDLHLGEGQMPKLHQRRVTGAEIVDGKADALDPETGQRVHQLDQRLGRALGQLHHQPVGRHVERAAHPLDQVGKVEVLQAERRNVERDAGVDAFVAPVEPLLEDRPEAPLGEVVDQPMLFGQRNEARRREPGRCSGSSQRTRASTRVSPPSRSDTLG